MCMTVKTTIYANVLDELDGVVDSFACGGTTRQARSAHSMMPKEWIAKQQENGFRIYRFA